MRGLVGKINNLYNFEYLTTRFSNNSLIFCINELALVFSILVCFLIIPVIIIMDLEFASYYYKYVVYIGWLYVCIIIFIFAGDFLVFYTAYELMVGLVFFTMYLTANSRGGVEAILFFIGWAVMGSLAVGCGIIYIVTIVQSQFFSDILIFNFTHNELYYLYLVFFVGFGAKLSLWPL